MRKNPGRKEYRLSVVRGRKQNGRFKAALNNWRLHVASLKRG